MVIGYTSDDDVSSEREELLENLAHVNYDEYCSFEVDNYEKMYHSDCFDIDESQVSSDTFYSMEEGFFVGPVDSAWPMKCHDNRHTGRSPYSTAGNPDGVEKWRFRCDRIEGSPAIGADGTIYFGTMGSGDELYALYPNGTLKWKYETDMWIWGSSPAIAEDRTIYVGSWDCGLYAIYPNGTLKWRFPASAVISSSPAIGNDGTIYFGNSDRRIFAVNPNGTEKWHYDTGADIWGDPAIGDDGTVYIGSWDTYFYALYPNNGTLRWRFKTGHYIKGPPSIADDGTIYIGSWDDYLYALYPNNGTMKWRHQVGEGTESNPSIGLDGTIYCGGGYLYAIYPNGTRKWTFDFGSNIHSHQSSPAIDSDGIIYIGTHIGDVDGGEIVAVNPDGTLRWRKTIANYHVDSSPCIGEDGTVYIGSSSHDEGYSYGILYAFGRGPLIVDAGGPYSGYAAEDIQFTGLASGGIPPYTYHWDFGDEGTSDEQNPIYAYEEAGIYNATFTVTDDEGNISSDNATVTVDIALPSVEIIKPENALYLLNIKLIPLPKPLIIGSIDIEVDASQDDVGIDRVEFYIDDDLKSTDTTEPYSWRWEDRVFFRHTIKVVAVDNAGKENTEEILARKFF